MVRRELLMYWPRQDDVAACVKTDAEASSEAVSLAVHQPMRFERRIIGSEARTVSYCDEHELLESFLTTNLPDGRVIVPIVGSSGTGKSHVVRWLHAQIRSMKGSEGRVVFRIPKGTSLKGVLGILLQTLQGSAYDRYRQELVRAQEELDPEEAAGLLCEMLAHSLGEIGSQARERLTLNPGDRSAQEREAFCRADMLPALLRNQLLRDQHFVHRRDGEEGVARRLVEQLTEERAAGLDDDRQHLFTADDLVFPPNIDRDSLGRAEAKALAQLDREERRISAARILNTALDDAKQRLLRLDPTVSDLFNAIREQLLKEGKELVLLVEDFAVLSGIQKQLLQVIIKEAFRDGRQVLCTMRTALAYTTGYMDTATVLTRANVEYRIPDEPWTEDEMLARIERLIGAYLNAARCGQPALEQAYGSARARTRGSDPWIPVFKAKIEPEARATLDEFGVSQDHYEFFPFNEAAIRELSREGCVQHGHLVYNPRFVIQNVINRVLAHRDLFEQGQFPHAGFGSEGRPLPARVVEEVKQRVPLRDLDRYVRFLAYWGGFPSSLKEIAVVEPRVFAAFGFEKAVLVQHGGASGPTTISPQTVTSPETETSFSRREFERARGRSEQDPEEARWEKLLESWRRGVSLPQVEANRLRKWIAEGLKEYVNWDWELHRPLVSLDGWFEYVYIPRAAGNQGRSAEESMVAVCRDDDLREETVSAAVQSALMALIRFHGIHKGNWDYPGADDDLPRYAAFLKRIAEPARRFVRRRYFRADWDSTPALVDGLLIGARALGIEAAANDKDLGGLIQSVFEATPTGVVPRTMQPDEGDTTGWTEFVETLRECRRGGPTRDHLSWQTHLLNLIGARQGQADTVHAINLVPLKPALEETMAAWEFRSSIPNPAGVPSLAPFRATYMNLKKLASAIPKAQARLFRWRTKTLALLGDITDKEALIQGIKESIVTAKAAGVTAGFETKKLNQLLEEFRSARVKAALDDTGKLDASAARGLTLTILGRGHEAVARICEELERELDDFLQSVEAELERERLKYGEDPLTEARDSLLAELREIRGVLEGMDAI
jgi:hypothetical protein